GRIGRTALHRRHGPPRAARAGVPPVSRGGRRLTYARPMEPVRLAELRVLEGPNLYFTRPAVKLTLAVPGWLDASEGRLAAIAEAMELPRAGKAGRPNSEQRRRFAARCASDLTHRLAQASGIRLAVRGRPGTQPGAVGVRIRGGSWCPSRGDGAGRPRPSAVRSPRSCRPCWRPAARRDGSSPRQPPASIARALVRLRPSPPRASAASHSA